MYREREEYIERERKIYIYIYTHTYIPFLSIVGHAVLLHEIRMKNVDINHKILLSCRNHTQ